MFECARTPKVSQNIVSQIRKAIFNGELKTGDKLPSEKELTEYFGVSKGSVREALQALETLGLLEIRKGALGGAFVTEVDPKKAKEGFSNFLASQDLTLQNLYDVRLILESLSAGTAARVITDHDLHRLEQIIQETRDALQNGAPVNFREKEVAFHLIIARATQNPLLVFLIDFVENLLLDAKGALNQSRDFSHRVLAAHEQIYEALRERNAEKAKNAIILDIENCIQEERMPEFRIQVRC